MAIDDARKRGGLLPLSEDQANKYATRAADLLSQIAINHSPVFDVNIALPLLLSALDDARPDIVKDDATVLGVIHSDEVQRALLTKAGDEKTPDDLKIALYKGLATNGPQLRQRAGRGRRRGPAKDGGDGPQRPGPHRRRRGPRGHEPAGRPSQVADRGPGEDVGVRFKV